jgi:prevent-host-death family protein
MQSIAVSDLRANLMKVLKKIEKGSSVIITSRGKAVAQLVPADKSVKQAENKILELRKTAKIHDIISPIEEKWKVNN